MIKMAEHPDGGWTRHSQGSQKWLLFFFCLPLLMILSAYIWNKGSHIDSEAVQLQIDAKVSKMIEDLEQKINTRFDEILLDLSLYKKTVDNLIVETTNRLELDTHHLQTMILNLTENTSISINKILADFSEYKDTTLREVGAFIAEKTANLSSSILSLSEHMKTTSQKHREDHEQKLVYMKKVDQTISEFKTSMKQDLSILESKMSTWTPITSLFSTIVTSVPEKIAAINLESVGVPKTAKQVLVYVEIETGTCTVDTSGRIHIYSSPNHKKQLLLHTYKQDAWSYNSKSIWLPIEQPSVFGKYDGKATSGNVRIQFKVVGHR